MYSESPKDWLYRCREAATAALRRRLSALAAQWLSLVALGTAGVPQSGHRRRCEELCSYSDLPEYFFVGLACEPGLYNRS